MENESRWWGAREIGVGRAGRWSLGPLALVGERRPFEWRLSWEVRKDPSLNELEFGISESSLPDAGDHDVRRFALSSDGETLLLQPQLADRPIVTRPSTPFTVLGGSTVNVFVTTPLWLEISQAEGKVLADIPTCRLSDTWFGESPRAGELCYASRTRARLDPERLVYHPVRAMTRISINNALGAPLLVERVKIPAPNLSLFIDRQGHLWTQAVHLVRDTPNQPSKVSFETPSLLISDAVEMVAPAREPVAEGLLGRAVHALIG